MKKHFKGFGFYIILLIVIIMIYSMVSTGDNAVTYKFSDLVGAIKSENIKELEVVENTALATLKNGTKIEVDIPSYNALFE
ncbi:MAG: ATP-dependent metallopeptidase FtsH/Yme1/Tma family protein, partial [Clostridia bacterium]|nr:ATP-dependent metallopeptidase FtsH/Yme1/Tma family protein [Clostridia bacterium]